MWIGGPRPSHAHSTRDSDCYNFATGGPMTIPFTQGIAPFPAWTITLPAPLAFPREPFAAALAEHARLLQEHAERLISKTRDFATSRDPHTPIVDLAAVIV